MNTNPEIVSDEVKEACAILTMRDMVQYLADREHISYENAMFCFTDSPVYEALFEFDTAVWKEGPVYLLDLYDEANRRNK